MPPGGEGKITIKVNTHGYGGRKIRKNITVQTNDPNKRKLNLLVTGVVEKFVSIVPSRILLTGPAGEPIVSVVKIIPEPKYPFKIVAVQVLNDKNIRYNLEEMLPAEGSGYKLTVENLKKEKGRYYDMLSLTTDSSIRPLVKIQVSGIILDPNSSEKK
ncbi:MAG: hypothetical protein KKH68_03360 [Proteobacteria bacterium]|nr:hypothetical protein [Pseudomonadota bacterium]